MKMLSGFTETVGIYEIHLKGHDCMAIRNGKNTIKITTERGLSDEQIKDLFLIAYGMASTGATLKDLIEVSAEEVINKNE